MSDKLRLFTGLAMPEPARRLLQRRLPDWRSRLPFERWANPEDWHITLHFLGAVPAAALPAVRAATDEAAARSAPVPLRLGGLGAFGPPRRPSLLWLGLAETPEPLRALHAALAETLRRAIGFEAERRPYRPHLTLARRWRGDGAEAAALAQALAGPAPGLEPDAAAAWTATEAHLFVSRPERTPMYEIVHRAALRGL